MSRNRVREYIGARYTLKIYENSQDPLSAEWEANTAYEPIVMVNYNNSSYISRKMVPPTVGNPVDNPSYWALSGLYNGQIASLQQRVSDLENEVATKEESIHKGTWIFVGDSFDAITDGWIDYVADALNVENYVKVSEGGAGFLGRSIGTNQTWLELLQNAAIEDPDDVRFICIVGGGNDNGNSLSDLNNAIQDFFTYVNTTFPNLVKGYLGFCGYGASGTTGAANAFTTHMRYQNAALAEGWEYLDNLISIPFNPANMQTLDPTHPDTRGVGYIRRGIIADILSSFNYYDYNTYTGTIDTTYMTFGSGIAPELTFIIDRKNTDLTASVAAKFGTFVSGYTSGTLSKFLTFSAASPFRKSKHIVLTGYVLSTGNMVLLPLVPNSTDPNAMDLVFPAGYDIGTLGVVIPDQTFMTTV